MIAQPHRTRALAFRAVMLALAVALVPLAIAPAASATVNGYVGTWTQAHPASAPTPRAFPSMAFDQTSGQLIAFGGMDSEGGSLGDTWAWDGSEWHQLNVTGPSARWGASMAWDPALGAIVLFGGLNGSVCNPTPLNDIWEWRNETWTQVHIAQPPNGYGFASMDFDAASGRMIIFGGTTQPGFCGLAPPILTGETDSFDGTTWTRVATTGPSPRDRASMGFDPRTGKIVLFGGFDGGRNLLGDTWTWDGSAWTQQPTSGPPHSVDGRMAFDGQTGQLLLFGGTGDEDRTWAWEGGAWREQDVLASPEEEIPDVHAHALAYDPATSQLVLFGGGYKAFTPSGQEYHNQTWTFAVPTTGVAWSKPNVSGSPSARIDDSIAYDPAIGSLVMFGGEDSNGEALNDTWVWDGSSWSRYAATNPPPARSGAALAYDPATGQLILYGGSDAGGNLLGDTWALVGGTWTRVATSGPSARTYAAMSFDPAEGKLVLFGGLQNGGTPLGDTWMWDGSSWSAPGVSNAPQTTPPARFRAAFSFDPATGQMLLFGGSTTGGTPLNDTWYLRFGHWYKLTASGGPSTYEAEAPVMDFDAATGEMVLASCCGGQPPWKEGEWTWDGTGWSARGAIDPTGSGYGWAGAGAGADMAFDEGTGQLVLFGNYSVAGPFHDETWVLFPTLGTNLSVTPASGPYSGTAEATARLTYGGTRVPGEPISFARGATAPCGQGKACPVTNAQGEATITGVGLGGLDVGTYGTGGTCAAAGLTASFGARDGYASASACGTLTVTPEETHIVESTNPANPVYGQPFTVTIKVLPLGTATAVPSGSVFYQLTRNPNQVGNFDWSTRDPRNDYQKGTLTPDGTGTAAYTTTVVVPPEYQLAGLAADFTSDDANVEGSFTHGESVPEEGAKVTISAADTTTAVSVDPPLAGPGQSVDITATIVAPAGFTPLPGTEAPVGPVRFYDGGTEIGSATPTVDPAGGDYTATLTIGDLALGPHTIEAVLDTDGENNYNASHGTTTAEVGQFPTTTSITSSASPSVPGRQVTFTAKVAGPDGTPTPSGSVRFQVDGADVGAPVVLDQAGEASYATADLAVGDHTVTAVYSPDTSLFTESHGELAGGQRVERAAEPGDAHPAETGGGGAAGSGDTGRCAGCAPKLSRLRVSPQAFRPADAAGGGATVSFRDTLGAKATLRVFGVRPGVVRAGRCVAPAAGSGPQSAKRCTRQVLVATIAHSDRPGLNQVPFPGRVHGEALPPGHYLLRASATLARQTSPTVRARFTILPRPRSRHPA